MKRKLISDNYKAGIKDKKLEVINLLDIDATPVHAAFETVDAAARRSDASAARSEIVGLIPERAVYQAAEQHIRLQDALADHVLERQVRASAGPGLGEWMDAVASASPSPGGGTVAAVSGAVAAVAGAARPTVCGSSSGSTAGAAATARCG